MVDGREVEDGAPKVGAARLEVGQFGRHGRQDGAQRRFGRTAPVDLVLGVHVDVPLAAARLLLAGHVRQTVVQPDGVTIS